MTRAANPIDNLSVAKCSNSFMLDAHTLIIFSLTDQPCPFLYINKRLAPPDPVADLGDCWPLGEDKRAAVLGFLEVSTLIKS